MTAKQSPNRKRCEVTNKVIYKHRQQAAAALATFLRDPNACDQPKSFYQCEHCSRWHLTSYTPAETRDFNRNKRRAAKHERQHRGDTPK